MSLLDDINLNSIDDIVNTIMKKIPQPKTRSSFEYKFVGFYNKNMEVCEYDCNKTYYIWAKNTTQGIFVCKDIYLIESISTWKMFPKEFIPINFVGLHPHSTDSCTPLSLNELLENDPGPDGYIWW